VKVVVHERSTFSSLECQRWSPTDKESAMTAAQPLLTSNGTHVFTEQLQAQTRPRADWTGRLREASAERTVVVDRPLRQVLPHLWNIKNIEYCERKADDVQVSAEESWTGRYVIRGRIFGVMPWQGPFRYVLHERGFHSEDAVPRRGGLRVNGGFAAESEASGPGSGTTSGTCCRGRSRCSSRS
jgi:hypothetical protein